MWPLLILIALLAGPAARAEVVNLPGPNGVTLVARLYLPEGPPKAPAIVALHGCGGPFSTPDAQWASVLTKSGHIVLMPDSFGSRGLGSQCTMQYARRTVTPEGLRRADAIASAQWLAARAGTPPGGVVAIGWSDGGSTVLATARVLRDLPPGLFRRFIAFYPACRRSARTPGWRAAAPLLIMIGESDDWTPAPPCHDLAARDPTDITLIAYPGAYHEFDTTSGLHKARGSDGFKTVGNNEPARQDALARVPAWLDGR